MGSSRAMRRSTAPSGPRSSIDEAGARNRWPLGPRAAGMGTSAPSTMAVPPPMRGMGMSVPTNASAKRPALSAVARHSARMPPSAVSEKTPVPRNTGAVAEGPVWRVKARERTGDSPEPPAASAVPMAL